MIKGNDYSFHDKEEISNIVQNLLNKLFAFLLSHQKILDFEVFHTNLVEFWQTSVVEML
jgi:hypothetical protein